MRKSKKELNAKKEMIKDFLRIADIIGMDAKGKEKRLDAMLEDLYKLMQKR